MQLRDASLLKSRCLLAGTWVSADSGATITVHNPATSGKVGTVPDLAASEIETAISAAAAAFPAWRARPARERATILRAWFDLIIANSDDLAAIMTAEQGKPLAEAKGEITYAAAFVEWFSEEAKRIYGDTIPAPRSDQRLLVLRQPIGVTAAITPWNFPAAMITRKAAPALAAGCTMIVRPAELTPLTALALGELAQRAGVPAGVLQIVTGDAKTVGAVLTASPTVRKLSFTGSTAVGRLLMTQCASTIKRLSLELGGNAPFIVFDDADLDAAVDGAMASKYRNAGQTCVCANRILVQAGIYEAFATKLTERVAALQVGAGTENGVTIGPLITPAACAKVQAHIADAVAKGASIRIGGKAHARGGQFIEPTVLTEVTPDMSVAREETFGPVAPLIRFTDEAEAIRVANDTIYGLAAYFYTRDASRAVRVSEALEYGMVGHNTGMISNEVAPFGGIKQSGLGREGSQYGIDEYLEMKYVCSAVSPE
jgi:succinate-semialdehyde dehydrogenase / glutarate-semialdehyde dehydrogenase